jgi:hypothetical protein
MRIQERISARIGKGIALVLLLVFSSPLVGLADEAQPRLESTIFSFDGQEFVRVKTTLRNKEGKPAVNTKLEHESPAYQALSHKHSYTGDATVFGRKYVANYAPLISDDGKLTGALFVGVAK